MTSRVSDVGKVVRGNAFLRINVTARRGHAEEFSVALTAGLKAISSGNGCAGKQNPLESPREEIRP
jgi:hypothetical protein